MRVALTRLVCSLTPIWKRSCWPRVIELQIFHFYMPLVHPATLMLTWATPLCHNVAAMIDKLGQCHGHLAAPSPPSPPHPPASGASGAPVWQVACECGTTASGNPLRLRLPAAACENLFRLDSPTDELLLQRCNVAVATPATHHKTTINLYKFILMRKKNKIN